MELISTKIPEFAPKYHEVIDKGLLWEMIKTEIRAATILLSKRKEMNVAHLCGELSV